jgi:hypothetical protein
METPLEAYNRGVDDGGRRALRSLEKALYRMDLKRFEMGFSLKDLRMIIGSCAESIGKPKPANKQPKSE